MKESEGWEKHGHYEYKITEGKDGWADEMDVRLASVDSDSAPVFVDTEGENGGVGVQLNKTESVTGAIRDEKGRLLPGVRLPGAGRKSRQYEKDMVNAIKGVLTPENIDFYLRKALDLAISQQSARGIVAVMSLGLAYGAGKPVQQIVADSGKTELLEQLLHGDNGEPLLPDPSAITSAHE